MRHAVRCIERHVLNRGTCYTEVRSIACPECSQSELRNLNHVTAKNRQRRLVSQCIDTRRSWDGHRTEHFILITGIVDVIFGPFSARGKAMGLYKKGMAHAEKRDLDSAIDSYTKVVNMKSVPQDIKAMALFNRALAYSRNKNDDLAEKDLKLVMAMEKAPPRIKTASQEKISRMAMMNRRKEEAE